MRQELENSARWLAWSADNARRWHASPPDYVVMVIESDLPVLPQQRPSWQRFFPSRPSLQDRIQALETIAADPRVRGVVLHMRQLEMPATSLEALRTSISAVRDAGKHVVAWATHYSGPSYFVACAANEILLQKGGSIGNLGRARSYLFLADALERVGLGFDAVKIAPHKTAADALTRTEMSAAAREMADWLLDAEREEQISAVADGRGLKRKAAIRLLDGAPYTDLEARDAAAVDAIVSEEDLPRHLGSDPAPLTLERWHSARKSIITPPPEHGERHVAIIRIEGLIVDGENAHPPAPMPIPLLGGGRSGDLTVTQEARLALEDDNVAAVVVWIDSPGGSATASEAMAAALERLARSKPLVAAMGSVAASGGYYVATPAHWIIAHPSTLTGSIGVLAGKLVAGSLLERLGIKRELLSRGPNSRIWDTARAFTDDERRQVLSWIERTYDVFLARVAASRDLDLDAVQAVAGGRVWTGRQGLENHLVDALGGLDDAIAMAREMAGLGQRSPVKTIELGRKRLAPGTGSVTESWAGTWPTWPGQGHAQDGATAILRHVLQGADQLAAAPTLCLSLLYPTGPALTDRVAP